ncbi:MAG: YbfB/YjiJ family MFS transporter [Actinomycetota bacterium]|nr:YbfB/YjiJ family MFS transporter [Actinomycetota bacterium]
MSSAGRPGQSPLLVVALAAAAVAVGHGFGRLTYAFVLPAMVTDLVGSYGRAGLLGTANLGAYLLGVLVVVSRSGAVSLAAFLRVGLLGATAGLVCLATASSYAALLVGMVLTGGFNAAIWVPASALVATAVPARLRGLSAGALGVGVGLAVVTAGAVTRLVQERLGPDAWRPVWAVTAALSVVVLIAFAGLLRPMPASGQRVRLRASVLARLPGAPALVVTYASFAFGYVVYASYLVAALRDDAGYSPAGAAAVYGTTGLTGIVGGLLVGRLSDRTGRRRVLVGGHVLLAACAAAVLLGAGPWVVVSAAAFGVFSSGLPAAVAAYVADHLEPAGVAAAFGVVTLAFGVSQTVGPPVGGLLADLTGSFRSTFALVAAVHLVGAVSAVLLPDDVPDLAPPAP